MRIRASVGGKLKETGIKRAIAIGGLKPGIAPITNPIKTPKIRQNKTLTENKLPK
tara:strand:+ start:238 stop:402 length:165 start_codon:yes stop_codon:yes gene_type:complete